MDKGCNDDTDTANEVLSEDTLSNNTSLECTPTTCNPALPRGLEDSDIVKIKGDAIGDTLYSERFVLNTLIKLTKDFELSEDLEKDLCTLWDMTIDRDVVLLLLEHNTLDIISKVIGTSSDNRLLEILLGIVGNLSCISEARRKLCFDSKIMRILLETIDSPDTLTLIQLMRFLSSVLVFENTGDENVWFQHFQSLPEFIDKLSFILHNSTNSALLTTTLEALLAMCSKFFIFDVNDPFGKLFIEMFVKPEIIGGVLEAFKQIMPMDLTDANDDTNIPTQKQQKIANLFLEIHCSICQYGAKSLAVYNIFMQDILNCINIIILPLTKPMYVIPLSQNSQGIIENVTEILSALQDPFKEEIVINFYVIWRLVAAEVIKLKQEYEESWEKAAENSDSNCSEDENLCGVNMCITICEYFAKMFHNILQEDLEGLLKSFTMEMATDLISKLQTNKNIEECYQDGIDKLSLAIKNVWNENSDL